jgi:hypothetical protein
MQAQQTINVFEIAVHGFHLIWKSLGQSGEHVFCE